MQAFDFCIDTHHLVALLSGARNQRNVPLAQKTFDSIQRYFFSDKARLVAAMVLLANTYALSGDLDTASTIHSKLNQSGVKKVPGLSSTVVNRQLVVSEH